jgi:hypothetical protein
VEEGEERRQEEKRERTLIQNATRLLFLAGNQFLNRASFYLKKLASNPIQIILQAVTGMYAK